MAILLGDQSGGLLGDPAYIPMALEVEFNFLPSFGNPLSTPVTSNVATVTGPDGDYPVILSGDASLEVSIDAGPFTNAPANFVIPTNTTIQARLTSSASYQTLVQGTVQIDTASENFDVYTQKDPAAVGGFAGGMSLGMGVGLTKIKYNAKSGGAVVESYLSEYSEEYS